MTKQFQEKVLRERIVDTDKYRYIAVDQHDARKQWCEIRRLPKEQLDTTAALESWETVAVIT